MDTMFFLPALAVALVIGFALGWLLASRAAASLRIQLAAAEERGRQVPELQAKLDEIRSDCADAREECARLSSSAEEREKAFDARLKELREAREALSAQFSEIGGKLLGEAQKNFLERADARFHQANEKTEAQLKSLLQPVEATLKRYEEGLSKVE